MFEQGPRQSIFMSAVINYINGRTDSFSNNFFFQAVVFYNNLELHVFYAIYATNFLWPSLDGRVSVDRNWIDLPLLHGTEPKGEAESYVNDPWES